MKNWNPLKAGLISLLLFLTGTVILYFYMSRESAITNQIDLADFRNSENKWIHAILFITCLVSLSFNLFATYIHYQIKKKWFHHLTLFLFCFPLMLLQSSGLYLLGVFNLIW
jgi:hypothetical protein